MTHGRFALVADEAARHAVPPADGGGRSGAVAAMTAVRQGNDGSVRSCGSAVA